MPGARIGNTLLKTNPPLLVIRDRGNAYVLRRKVDGIHWEEAVEQLYRASHLRALDESLNLRRMIRTSVDRTVIRVFETVGCETGDLTEILACFVSWNLQTNQPVLQIDLAGTFLHTIWLA